MNYLGIDYGEKRIGLSYGDDDVRLAVPIAAAVQPTLAARMEQIDALIRTRRIGELVVGYPYNMDGSVGFKAREVDAFIEKLVARFSLPVHRTDERLTSADAQNRMKEAGRGKGGRSKQSLRAKLAERKSGALDSRAATLILQDYLDALPQPDGGLPFADADEYFSDDYPQLPWADKELADADGLTGEDMEGNAVTDRERSFRDVGGADAESLADFDHTVDADDTDATASEVDASGTVGTFGAGADEALKRGRGSRKRRGDRRRR